MTLGIVNMVKDVRAKCFHALLPKTPNEWGGGGGNRRENMARKNTLNLKNMVSLANKPVSVSPKILQLDPFEVLRQILFKWTY